MSQGKGGQITGTYRRAGCEGSIAVSSRPADKKTATAAGGWRIAADPLQAERDENKNTTMQQLNKGPGTCPVRQHAVQPGLHVDYPLRNWRSVAF